MILGLTGAYCAGKNALAAILAEKGFTCIDVDKLGHEAMELSKAAIVSRFGQDALAADGSLDRRALARIVFSDPAALADQEAIVHPAAIRLVDERIAAAEEEARAAGRKPLVCVNAALLHRAGKLDRYDAIIELRAFLALRILRGIRRDRSGLGEVLRRIRRQRGFGASLRAAVGRSGPPIIVVRNDGGASALRRAVERAIGVPRPAASRAPNP